MVFFDEVTELFNLWVQEFTAGNIDACVELYTDDGAIYSPYELPSIGRDALRETHRQWLAAGGTNKKIRVFEAHSENDLGYCIAAYSEDYPQDDGSLVKESGKSVNIVKRQPDGSWKLHISSLNSDDPPLAES